MAETTLQTYSPEELFRKLSENCQKMHVNESLLKFLTANGNFVGVRLDVAYVRFKFK